LPDDRWNIPGDGISVEEQDAEPNSLLNYYRKMLALRMAHPALVDGDFEIIELETSGIGPWGFVRSSDDDAILAVFNFGTEEQEIIIDEFPFEADGLIDLITGQQFPAPAPGMSYSLVLAPASALFLSTIQ
jgi:glycosidase